MSKANQKVMAIANQEAFDFLTFGDDDVKAFWEDAEEDYRTYLENLRYQELGQYDFYTDDNGCVHAVVDEDEDFFIEQQHDFWEKHIKGHSYEEFETSEELRNAYSFWSDLYKEAYGVRPHYISF